MPLCSAITPKGMRPKAVYFRPLIMPRFIVLAGNQRILEKRLLRRTENAGRIHCEFFGWWSKTNMCTYGSGAGDLVMLDVK